VIWLLAGAALAQEPSRYPAGDPSFYQGQEAGEAAAQSVPMAPWLGLGAAAGCVGGCPGVVGVGVVGWVLEPDVGPGQLEHSPTAPDHVTDPAAWALGYSDAYGRAVHRKRTLVAVTGGTLVVVAQAAVIATVVTAALVAN
jgi:hypothetical protein